MLKKLFTFNKMNLNGNKNKKLIPTNFITKCFLVKTHPKHVKNKISINFLLRDRNYSESK